VTGAQPTELVLDGDPQLRLSLFDLGLACCAVEFVAASLCTEALALLGARSAPLPEANVLVVSGTLTDVTAPAVLAAYAQLPEPRWVVSFGACANTGGPYWDSYSVTKGVDQLLPVDVYVPGCPPRPEALLQALVMLGDGRRP
jgi:NADH-quinone oxidoreductase subunit B